MVGSRCTDAPPHNNVLVDATGVANVEGRRRRRQ
jgi:hypothetical protein